MDSHTFNIPIEESTKVVESLKSYLLSNGYIIQEFLREDGLILQIKKGGGFKTAIGLSTALNVNIEQTEDCFSVSFSNGKWVNKAAAAGVSLFILWPLLITSAVGAYRQAELPGKITTYINGEVSKFYRKRKIKNDII